MIIFAILKSFFNRLIPFIIVLICLYAFQQHNALNRVKNDYAAHMENDEKAADLRKQENEQKEQVFRKDIERINAEAKSAFHKYKLNRYRETKNLKDLYENRLNIIGRNWSERVRLEREATGLPTSASNSSGLAENTSECHRAYITLEDACRITTIDYNRLREWGDATCELVGCK